MFHYLNRSEIKICLYGVVFFIDFTLKLVVAELTEDLIPVLYLKYKDALNEGVSNISVRRVFTNNKQYEIHVQKLKEVNGFKVHNLMIKETIRSNDNPLIYINNPVESKVPYTYLSLEEFKNVLTSRIQAQKDELAVKRERVRNNVTHVHAPTKGRYLSQKITPRQLLKTHVNKVESNILHKGGTDKDRILKVPDRTLLLKEFKPKLTTKVQSQEGTTVNKIYQTLMNNTTFESFAKLTLPEKSISMLSEKKTTTPKTADINKQYNETNKIQQTEITNKPTTQIIQNITVDFGNDSNFSISSTTNFKNGTADIKEVKELSDNDVNTIETQSLIIKNNTETEADDTLITIVNAITSSSYNATSSQTIEDIALNTKQVKKATPKRSTVYKQNKEKKVFPTTLTKWKRSTLGRPLVFME